MASTTIHLLPGLLLKVAVKGRKAGEAEDGVKRLGAEFAAPVPRRGQASVDTRAGILKVVCSGTVKAAQEEVTTDGLRQLVGPTVDALHPLFGGLILWKETMA